LTPLSGTAEVVPVVNRGRWRAREIFWRRFATFASPLPNCAAPTVIRASPPSPWGFPPLSA